MPVMQNVITPELSPAEATASFRDPAGRLFVHEGRVLRGVTSEGAEDLQAFLHSTCVQRMMAAGTVVPTRVLEEREVAQVASTIRRLFPTAESVRVLEHEPISFVAYPPEWSPKMLFAAAGHTLDIAEALLDEGLGLKDATPYNILFRGPKPVLVDVLSVERRDPRDPLWLPYAQFTRTFLLPLLLAKHFGISPAETFSRSREGLEPDHVYNLCSWWRRLTPPFLGAASLPTWLNRKAEAAEQSIYVQHRMDGEEQTRFVLKKTFRRLRRQLLRAKPGDGKSAWANYSARSGYSPQQLEAKRDSVEQAVRKHAPKRVLDIGANDGLFSLMAARMGAEVVALDSDPVMVDRAWERAAQAGASVLPLVVNIADPSPGRGWRNRECAPFLQRARGSYDAVLMLAMLHHLLVTERIPLVDVLNLAAELTRKLLIIEFVGSDDPMFRRILRGREGLFQAFNQQAFEAACRERFEIASVQPIPGSNRSVYVLIKKNWLSD